MLLIVLAWLFWTPSLNDSIRAEKEWEKKVSSYEEDICTLSGKDSFERLSEKYDASYR